MSSYNNLKTYCPNCNHTIFRGTLAFGPNIINCKKCNTNINTGLTNWNDLSFFEKLGNVLKEFLSPNILPMDSAMMRSLMSFFIWCFTVIPSSLIITIPVFSEAFKSPENHQTMFIIVNILLIICISLYPIFLIYRIVKIRNQSLKLVSSEIIPRW